LAALQKGHIYHTKENLPTSPYMQGAPSSAIRWQFSQVVQHIFTERKQLGITLTKMHWQLGRKSKRSKCNKSPIYKVIFKPICTFGIKLWGPASTWNIQILGRFQSELLRMIVDAPWYVPNTVIWTKFQTPAVKEEIRRYSSQYSVRLSVHPNDLVVNFMAHPGNRRLRRHIPNELPTSFSCNCLICSYVL
jgi:hypothetical protein